MNAKTLSQKPSSGISFADVAHQMLRFDPDQASERLVLDLLSSKWVQRLRRISQTGNTRLVYMFAEHSRFGHSLGVAFLATQLMRKLSVFHPEQVAPYQNAVAAAALLHDIGHLAPGSHLGERIWHCDKSKGHESLSARIILEDTEIRAILDALDPELAQTTAKILAEDSSLPEWTHAIISGGGWNADRGNWAIVDSAMCSVSYGRYNVDALLDAFRLSDDGQLVLHESRLDALTHFFVARDSMYRQVYQHRVLQAADTLTLSVVKRARELYARNPTEVFSDTVMQAALGSKTSITLDEDLHLAFAVDEYWWGYHLQNWCESTDPTLKDLSTRLRDRKLFKTVRVDGTLEEDLAKAQKAAKELGLDPEYYVSVVSESDRHRTTSELAPKVILETGELAPADEVEPLIANIIRRTPSRREWLAVPAEIKQRLGRIR